MQTKKSEVLIQPSAAEKNLGALFEKTFGGKIESFNSLKGDGSSRIIFRIKNSDKSAIGVFGPDKLENAAFLEFSRHFKEMNFPVPEIYAEDRAKNIYLEEDFGDITLFNHLNSVRTSYDFPQNAVKAYCKAIEWLPKFQTEGKKLNYKYCYPRRSFDKQSIMWDLNYFKYYFLRLSGTEFNEQKLENDFEIFSDFLLKAESDFFLYRDFQSRNIMLKGGKPFFIDYQGGRKGALQYDIASLLYDGKADIPPDSRKEFLNHYLDALGSIVKIDKTEFIRYYNPFAYIRIMQAMGAYGLRGFYEKKTLFLQSIPYAVRNIEYLLHNTEMPVKVPELMKVFKRIAVSSYLRQFGDTHLRLTIRLQSFSFRNGVPSDEKGHGGGYIFDCRALPNPGRVKKYARMTGKDAEIIKFFESESAIEKFIDNACALIRQSIENYQKRNFTDLMVSFGCTGGRHRSVYCCERVKKIIESEYKVKIEISHREIRI
ncbi:MAG: phosphotransferase [Elusimicrobia bacterium]|nr:phosphotransferase [Elusimicrobiota bacterium]